MGRAILRAALALGLAACFAAVPGAAEFEETCGVDQPKAACVSRGSALPDPAYRLVQDSAGGWSGRNPALAIGLQFTDQGAQLRPDPATGEAWNWGLTLARPSLADEVNAYPAGAGDRIDYRSGRLAEWFVNTPKGLRHGLQLEASDLSASRLVFHLAGNLTPKIGADGRGIVFTDPTGRPVLAYRDLTATDAAGRSVGVRWVRQEGGETAGALILTVEASEHELPIKISGRLTRAKSAAHNHGGDGPLLTPGIEAAPGNDTCAGAEIIPGGGPFPALSATHNITDATTTGDPPAPSCQSDVSRSIWFSFTPLASGYYTFSLCSDAPTLTTLDDTVLAIYSATGTCAGLAEMTSGCDDDSCSVSDLQSVVSSLPLTAGTTYYAVAWKFGADAPDPASADIQLRVVQEAPPPPPPANDQCPGAVVIPPSGPFPYTAPLVADITGATTTGDPPAPSCQPAVSRSVWYAFTPAATGSYTFSLCADAPTGTTVDDTVLGLYSSLGTCSGLNEIPGGCDDDSCALEGNQSVLTGATLTAGTLYYLVAWKFDTPAPAAGNTAVQLRVSRAAAPGNDTCASAIALSLDTPVSGTTAGASDDTELSGSACFTGLGQTPVSASGGDVAYRFTAPAAGAYSFRVNGYDTARNAVLYVASDCPAAPPPGNIAGCLGAANRNLNFPAEEVSCLALSAGQQVYVYVDETSLTSGSSFTLEVNRCIAESEPNSPVASAAIPACGLEGAIAPLGDVDFFTLGNPDAASRVFALVDGVASDNTGFDLRMTTATDTLEFDDADNDVPFGTLSPNLSGTPASGSGAYLRVSHSSATQVSEPYRLYASVQPPSASATLESEPNNSIASADTGANLYFSGALANVNDLDYFSFTAVAGELLQIGLDLDPGRNNTPFDGTLALLDANGAALVTVNDGGATSSTASGAGTLTATTPRSPGEALTFRAGSTGTYYMEVSTSSGTNGDYLLSIARNCRVSPAVDLAVTQVDSPDPVSPGANVTYAVSLANLTGSAAKGALLRDDLPAGVTLVSATPSQGSCSGSGPVFCQLGGIAAGGTASVSIIVGAPSSGTITNKAQVSSYALDTVPGNDSSSQSTTVGSPDADGDGVPDAFDCAPADSSVWAIPGEAAGLIFPSLANTSQIQWGSPVLPGGVVVLYDVLRSGTTSFTAAACLGSNQTATSLIDPATPAPLLYYLVRSENACGGNLGAASNGVPRTGIACP